MIMHLKGFIFTLVLLTATTVHGQQNQKVLIGAASDLRFALDSMMVVFKEANPVNIEAVYGSSGKLFEQISNGAPFDIFFSADIEYPLHLQEKGLTASEIHTYGIGRLVLWSKRLDPNQGQITSLQHPSIQKVAIANPTHAPYGKRAVESLEHYRLYEELQKKLVYGENISQAAQFVTTGAADIGLIALSLALSPNMKRQNGKYYLIPEESHRPLQQGVVITIKGKDKAYSTLFMEFVKSTKAIAILRHFGFMQVLNE